MKRQAEDCGFKKESRSLPSNRRKHVNFRLQGRTMIGKLKAYTVKEKLNCFSSFILRTVLRLTIPY